MYDRGLKGLATLRCCRRGEIGRGSARRRGVPQFPHGPRSPSLAALLAALAGALASWITAPASVSTMIRLAALGTLVKLVLWATLPRALTLAPLLAELPRWLLLGGLTLRRWRPPLGPARESRLRTTAHQPGDDRLGGLRRVQSGDKVHLPPRSAHVVDAQFKNALGDDIAPRPVFIKVGRENLIVIGHVGQGLVHSVPMFEPHFLVCQGQIAPGVRLEQMKHPSALLVEIQRPGRRGLQHDEG
jgi:hypothetical protein